MTEFPNWKNLNVTSEDGITEVAMHTAGGHVVWTPQVAAELTELFGLLAMRADSKVLILTGTKDRYCTTLDGASFSALSWREIWTSEQQLMNAVVNLNNIVIAAINGPVTIHSEIPVLADIVLATPETTFSDFHFQHNVAPGDGVQLIWSRLLGTSRASYFLLTGEKIASAEAQRLGAVHEIMELEQLMPRARKMARDLAARPAAVLAYTKAALRLRERRNFGQDLSHSLAIQGLSMYAMGLHRAEES